MDCAVDDDHAFAGRQARGLHDNGRALAAHPVRVESVLAEGRIGGRRNAVALQEFLGVGLGALQLRGGAPRPEAAQPRGGEGVDDAVHERRLGSDDGQTHLFGLRQRHEAGDVVSAHIDVTHARFGGGAAVARRDQDFRDLG
jgi:hypothetical protein